MKPRWLLMLLRAVSLACFDSFMFHDLRKKEKPNPLNQSFSESRMKALTSVFTEFDLDVVCLRLLDQMPMAACHPSCLVPHRTLSTGRALVEG